MRPLVTAVAVIALLVSACGDDDDEAPDSGAPTTVQDETGTDTSGDEPATEGDLAAFCTGAIDGEALFNAGPELDEEGNPTPDGLEQFADQIAPLMDDMEQNAPEELVPDVDTLLAAIRAALETGDESGIGDPEVLAADSAIDEFVFENCDLAAVQDVTAVDYEYENLPETLPAGQVGLRMDNQGDEVHEAVLFRIDDSVDSDISELLELPEEEAQQLTEFVGVAFAGPGDTGYAVVDLEPGRYAAVCFIPVGTTSMEALDVEGPDGGESEAPPHFTQGMAAEFQVE